MTMGRQAVDARGSRWEPTPSAGPLRAHPVARARPRARGRRRTRSLASGLALLALIAPGAVAAPQALERSVVLTQLPADAAATRAAPRAGGLLRADYGPGCRLVRLDPDGTLRVLSEGFESACEPCVSFDGERILFAGRRSADEPWNVWEMDRDGGALRQVTREAGNCRRPAYQSTLYTIDSSEPWAQVMFQSDLAARLDELGAGPATSLYSCRLDGSGLQRLTHNLGDDLDPYLMSDGMVLCSSWQRRDLRHGALGRVALFALNPDGADYHLYSDDGPGAVRHMGCETVRGEVVFVEAERVGWDGAGRLGAVSLRRPFHSYRALTGEGDGLYHSPTPLDDGALLVARRPAEGGGTHALVRLDPASGEVTPVFDDPQRHDFHARLLAPRARPDGRSTVVQPSQETGKLYCLDAELVSPERRAYLERGTVRAVRLVEGVPQATDAPPAPAEAAVHGLPPLAPRRVLGVAPVEADGSFQLEVPADTPLMLQALDADGLALEECGWIWARPREWRGCIGCHEDPERTPPNRFVEAVGKPAVVLAPPPSARRAVTFRREVLPVVERRCAGCHTGSDVALDLDARPGEVYLALLQAAPSRAQAGAPLGRYVHPGRARTSPLVWLLLGRVTARPWDGADQDGELLERHPAGALSELTDAERAIFVEWIDLGAAWDAAAPAPVQPGRGDDR
jgi:hypothetical protein